jgi:hypothetical protein
MYYIQAKCSEFPPYLLNFQGSPGERHVENIKVRTCELECIPALDWLSKILREVGIVSYSEAVTTSHGPNSARLLHLAADPATLRWAGQLLEKPVGTSSSGFHQIFWKRLVDTVPAHLGSFLNGNQACCFLTLIRLFATTMVLSSP